MEWEKITSVVSDVLQTDLELITPQTSFVADLGADSLELFTILTQLEEVFSLTLTDKDFSQQKTVGDVAELIEGSRTK